MTNCPYYQLIHLDIQPLTSLFKVGGDNRMIPRTLAHILTHEVGHLFHAPHTFGKTFEKVS